MKIANRGGHNFLSKGAVALIDEVVENRKVNNALNKYLSQMGISNLDVTPSDCNSNTDLYYGVSKSNNWGADIFTSIHFNKAYSSYDGAIGVEVCVKSYFPEAQRVLDKLVSLGFKNRGLKYRDDLYELNCTNCKAMIIEVCFVEATEDVALYNRLGADAIGKAIAESMVGQESKPLTNAQISKLTANGKMITGESITFEATADTDLYKFTLQRKSNGEWINASNWQSSNKCQWTFTTEGDYLMSCQVKRNGSTKEYDNYEHVHFSIKARKKSKVESFIVEGNKEANSPLVFKTVASEDSEYKYWIYDYEANQWMKMIDYSYYSEFKHTFTSKKKFRVVVHVRNKYSTNDYDDRGEIELDFTKEDHSNCEHKIDELNGKIKTLEEINKELQKKLEDIKNIVK